MIGILNYGSGNITSIVNVLKNQNIKHIIVDSKESVQKADKYILPGVGNFRCAINKFYEKNFADDFLDSIVNQGKCLLGICVGMQMFANYSDEGSAEGLDLIPGKVRKFSNSVDRKLPHMGWSSISVKYDSYGLFEGVDCEKGFYFLHSYFYIPKNDDSILAYSDYSKKFCSVVTNGKNIFGVQFHPEKSHRNGEVLLRNFSRIS